MFGKKPPAAANPQKEALARHLRLADTYAREGRLDESKFEIDKALAIDPKNYYARSFAERIRVQRENAKASTHQEAQFEGEALDQRAEAITRHLKNAEKMMKINNYPLALEEIRKVYAIDPQNFYALAYSDRIDQLMGQEGNQPAAMQPPPQPKTVDVSVPRPSVESPGTKPYLTLYRQMLREMWFDGKLSEQEVEELKSFRAKSGITADEHNELDKQVRVDAYVEALRIAWRDGIISKNEEEVLQLMRRKYDISLQEHMSAEAKILFARAQPNAKGTILIVDDERSILLSVSLHLKRHGYDVLTADSVEKALAVMEQSPPTLILSDLMFKEGELSGTDFYQRVRADARFVAIPFLLMSGVSDEFVVRAGVRMGVDSFIRKPFDLELLLATVEGKLVKEG